MPKEKTPIKVVIRYPERPVTPSRPLRFEGGVSYGWVPPNTTDPGVQLRSSPWVDG